MDPFLKQVARHYFADPALPHTCFVFPNRRSLVFFRKYLGECMAASDRQTPMLCPPLLPINDFFYRVYRTDVTDRIRLLVTLYDCYKALYPQAESLDDFLFWGDVILSDFDDVDKYLVDAEALFRNVVDLKSLQDDYAYLSDRQREAIARFVTHFRDGTGRLTVDLDHPGVKARFLQIWNLLYPLYRSFNQALRDKGMAYEGMVYRALLDRLRGGTPVRDALDAAFPGVRKYVFVGLNALNRCEQLLLRRMRDAGVAEFNWDYVSPAIRDPRNKSSLFMHDNVAEFPGAFPIDPDGLPDPEVHVVSVPSSVGQTKLAPYILSRVQGDPVETAFVLPDEQLLLPLLNTIPPQWDSINVTMGYPMTGSAVYAFLRAATQLQLHIRQRDDGVWFYHRQVSNVFSSSLFREVLTPGEAQRVTQVKQQARYYVPAQDLQGGPLLDRLFRPVVTRPSEALAAQNQALAEALRDLLAYVGWKLREVPELLLELDFAKRCHQAIGLLAELSLEVLPATWLHLLDTLLQAESVPFRGEPLQGLQIMGPLETRALDFRTVVILSANEGVFPRRSTHTSFIPPELRRGFDLPTYEYQDAVWAYYFYRLLQRAEQVYLVYDSRTEGLKSGEESRYIKQLQYHFRLPLQRHAAVSSMRAVRSGAPVPKTPEALARIRAVPLSASTLQAYLACPAKFYYQVVEGLKPETEVAESLDAGMLGNVFHDTMHDLYAPYPLLRARDIAALQADRPRVQALVRKYILEQMHSIEVTGRNLVLEKVILDYVQATLQYDRKLLETSGSDGFRIYGLERFMEGTFHGFRLLGYVDRMDSYRPGEVRIVDYKTGRVEDEDINITDENAAAVVDKLFGPVNKGRPKIALQLFLYDLFAQGDDRLRGQQLVNAIYSAARLFTTPLEERACSSEFARLTRQRLTTLLDELVDPDVPFHRTDETETCSYCDFKTICGR